MASIFKVGSGDGTFEIVDTAGTISIKVGGSQQSAITDASTAHALNSTFSDTEVETALNALGTKINSVIAALEGAGIVAA